MSDNEADVTQINQYLLEKFQQQLRLEAKDELKKVRQFV
jgi:hypothetical protein